MSVVDWVPGVGVARAYRLRWLGRDVAAGLVLTALLVPAGMGYAEVAGLPPITGLYATIVPLLVYAVLGPSRILVMGPDSALAPLIAATIVPLAGDDPERLLGLAAALSIIAGAICLAGAFLKAGFITELLSTPLRLGYLNGLAVVILASQLPKLFGVTVESASTLDRLREFGQAVLDGETNRTALAVGVVALAVMLACRRWARHVPAALVVVVTSIALVKLAGLDDDVSLVGELPRGLPGFVLPHVTWSDLGALAGGALAIAFVSFAETSVLSRAFAERRHEQVDPNRELFALGSVNVAAGFFQGFPVSSSASRTPAAELAGSQTQLTGVIGALAVAGLLVFTPGLLADLPSSVLAAIVIAAASSLVDVPAIVRLWHLRRSEFLLSLVCFLGVVVLGVIPGIVIAVGLAIASFVRRAWRPYTAELVRVSGLKGYHDAERHPEGRRVPGLLLYRFDAPLFFANAEWFRDDVRARVRDAPGGPVKWVVVTAEPITDVDTTAADALGRLYSDLTEDGIVLAFAEMKGVVRERLEHYGLVERIGPDRFYRTVGQAVKAYVVETGTHWVDWEDRPDRTP